tara:strand:- start:5234 stop:5767 length:534 start_codon:yes stop_codon:yes gene_type:complete
MAELPQKKTFVVTLKGLAPWISEIHYEKEEQDLKLYFALQKKAEVNVIVEDREANYKRIVPLGAFSRRLLSHVEYKPASDLYLTFATKKDFEECKTTPRSLKDAFQELRQYGGEDASLLVLFEAKEGQPPQGLLWSKKKDLREKALSQYLGKQKGNWALFQGKDTLSPLKESLKELL